MLSPINTLEFRRSNELLNLMFNLVQDNKYKKEGARVTRAMNSYVFDTQIVHLGVYANSPFYLGTQLWDNLPHDIKNIQDKQTFKRWLQLNHH